MTGTRQTKPNRQIQAAIERRKRAERLLVSALDVLLNNRAFDISWINQGELRPRDLLRGGRVADGAIADFAKELERECERAA